MKTSFLIIAAFAALVAADVTITDLPSCAITCATSASSDAGCDISDIGCFCSSDTFATSMYACVPQSCSADDQNTTFTVAEELCAQAGIPDETLQSETGAATSNDAATDAPAAATSMDKTETAAAMTTTTSSIPEQGLYAGAGTTVTVTAPCSASSTSSNSTATTASVVAYTGAASNVQVGMGMMALLGFAVL